MKYEVIWKSTAIAELAEIWNRADDRAAMTEAADELDESLQSQPFEVGESRFDNFRIAFQEPIGIIFEVIESKQQVFVLRVWAVD